MAKAPTLGERVRELRSNAGMTLAACSAASGLSVSYLSDIEHDRTIPSLERLNDLAHAFGLDARGLLRGVRKYGEID